jgi:hypothetical protein
LISRYLLVGAGSSLIDAVISESENHGTARRNAQWARCIIFGAAVKQAQDTKIPYPSMAPLEQYLTRIATRR